METQKKIFTQLAALQYLIVFAVLGMGMIVYGEIHHILLGSGVFLYTITSWFPYISAWQANAIAIATLGLSALLTYRVVWFFTKNHAASWIAGLLYSLSSVLLSMYLPLLFIISIRIGLPLVLHALMRYLQTQQRSHLFFFLVQATIWTIICQPMIITIIIMLVGLLYTSPTRKQKIKQLLVGFSGIAITLIIISSLIGSPVDTGLQTVSLAYSADFSWLLDFPLTAWFGLLFKVFRITASQNGVPALSIFILAYLSIYLMRQSTDSEESSAKRIFYFCWILIILGLLLAAGPYVKIANSISSPAIPLPGILLYPFSIFGTFFYYYVGIALLGASVLIAYSGVQAKKTLQLSVSQSRFMYGVILLMLIGQYVFQAIPGTAVVTYHGYHLLPSTPDSNAHMLLIGLDSVSDKHIEQIIAHDSNYKPIHVTEPIAIEQALLSSMVPQIIQNTDQAYTHLLSYYDIGIIDVIKQKPVPFYKKPLQTPASEIFAKTFAILNKQLPDDWPVIYTDKDHVLIKPIASFPEGGLLVLDGLFQKNTHFIYAAGNKKQEKITASNIKQLKTATGITVKKRLKLIFYNFENQNMNIDVQLDTHSTQTMNLSLSIDGMSSQASQTTITNEDQTVHFSLPSLTPGPHVLQLEIERPELSTDNTAPTKKIPLTVSSISYAIY